MKTFTGTNENDTFEGTKEADRMIGLYGDDDYFVNSRHDEVIENFDEGIDLIVSRLKRTVLPVNVEACALEEGVAKVLIGNDDEDYGNYLFGNENDNTINAKGGFDNLYGYGGRDKLIGGDGADWFMYTAIKDSLAGKKTADQIKDFNGEEGDRIHLMELDCHFIGSEQFSKTAGELRLASNKLALDQNGDGNSDFEIMIGKANITEEYLFL